MFVRLVIVFGGLTMSMVRKNLGKGLGKSLKNLTGSQKNIDELLHKSMGSAAMTSYFQLGQ
ncbi:hypothetical protein Taro_056441 [Colocasia esculenta]|uniref:Uncharacterized protein n=1 Tax=Colocasia esculenta TaxID=4460 RepID=A0A843XXD1_COLES|nr:hypothetical protein [Colocasia esculenta]